MRLPNSLRGTLNYSPLATLFALSETTGGDFRDALDVEHSILRQKPQPYDVRFFVSPLKHCRRQPKYVDGATVHNYCGMTCANLAMSVTGAVQTNRASGSSARACGIPGCPSPPFNDPTGTPSKYCNKIHRWLGRNGCISCRRAPGNGPVVFCQSCQNQILRTSPMIVQVPKDHWRYEKIESQFRLKWRHNPGQCPDIRAIYKIVSTAANVARYQQYIERIETRGNFASQGRSRGNENRRWHGTTRRCNIGDDGETTLCRDPSCFLCGIIRTSFDISFSARSRNFKRFGTGIYTSSTSSKANDYSRNGSPSDSKAMILSKVAVGRGYKLTVDNTTLTQPPAGFDSIIGEVGNALNYDELVVYNNDAILPSYLVIYDTP